MGRYFIVDKWNSQMQSNAYANYMHKIEVVGNKCKIDLYICIQIGVTQTSFSLYCLATWVYHSEHSHRLLAVAKCFTKSE